MTNRLPIAVLFACLAAIVSPAGGIFAQDDLLELEEQAIRAAVERVAPSVVKIETIGGLEVVGKLLVGTGPTTGLAVREDGYVISSAFNFVQKPSSILVTLPSGARAAAQIVARDQSRMLVLLKVQAQEKLIVPQVAPRGEMTVGQWAIAVGRTFDPSKPNISVGVLSATNRIWSRAIQTDAKISPANYGGPLIDIQGRVLGILVPLSPQGQGGEVAGTEWYDSGIGFAIPLEAVLTRLPALADGKDLHPGLMGISLTSGDIYSLPAELAAVQGGSPAYKAGLRAGDTIVEIDGVAITRQAQLKHALGPRYGGDMVHVTYLRGKEQPERKTTDVELAEKLIPYEHPFLGILPVRDQATGVTVRHVFPSSPAQAAGILAGDSITKLGAESITDAAQLRLGIANLEPGAKAKLEISRGGETKSLEFVPGKLPTAIPPTLAPHAPRENPPPAEKPATGLIDIKLPEEANECLAYVPETYDPAVSHGVLIVLSAPGPVDKDKLAARWKAVCQERQLIVLAPVSADRDKWQATESAVIRKFLEDLSKHYRIDATRVATYGYQVGGSMAFLVGLEHVDRVRAICAIDAVPPPRTSLPDGDPVNRLAFFIGRAEKSVLAPATKVLLAALAEEKLPVTEKRLGDDSRDLTAEELAELARWIDTLDRI